jgi:hypothetical protein
MTDSLLKASHYGDRENKAVFLVLTELAQVLGSQRGNFVLVGGLVPGLLYENADPKHVGTLDIDINLNTEALAEYDYAELVKKLESHGYERDIDDLKPFQMRRTIDLEDGTRPIPVIIDLLMPRDAVVRELTPPLIDGLRVQRIDGGIYALRHFREVTLDGQMPDGRQNQVKIFVATPPALLVMKGYALANRDKKKDAYDIWFCIRNHEGGAEALAQACRPLMSEREAKTAFENIASKFRSQDDFGPETVRHFLEDSPDKCGGMTLEQIQNDAYFRVREWLQHLGL